MEVCSTSHFFRNQRNREVALWVLAYELPKPNFSSINWLLRRHGVAASVLHQLRVLLELYPFVLANHGQPAALLAVPAGRPGRGLGGDPKTRPANVGSPGGGRCQ